MDEIVQWETGAGIVAVNDAGSDAQYAAQRSSLTETTP